MPKTLDEIATELTADPEFMKLSLDEQDTVFAELAKDAAPSPRPNPIQGALESPAAKMVFPGVGGMLGGAGGTALGAAAGGVGALPGGFVGATTGAGAGEALRQGLSQASQGNFLGQVSPQSIIQSFQGPMEQAATEAAGMGAGAAIPSLMHGLGTAARFTAKNIGQLLTGVPAESIDRAITQGPSKVIRREYLSGRVPVQLREKVISGLQKFRDSIEASYGQAIKNFGPEIEQTQISTQPIVASFRQKLMDIGALAADGNPAQTILPNEVVSSIGSTNRTLAKVLETLMGQTEAIPTSRAIQLKRELDTLLDFDPNEVRKITTTGQGAIYSLRTALKTAIDEAVPGMKAINDRYHVFRDTYDAVQPRLRDANIEDTLHRLANTRNTFNFRELESINSMLGPEDQFLNQTLDFLAGSEFGKKPMWLRAVTFPLAGYSRGGLPGAILAEIAASPQALGLGLKGAEMLGKPAAAMGQAIPQEAIPPSIAAVIRALQSSQQP